MFAQGRLGAGLGFRRLGADPQQHGTVFQRPGEGLAVRRRLGFVQQLAHRREADAGADQTGDRRADGPAASAISPAVVIGPTYLISSVNPASRARQLSVGGSEEASDSCVSSTDRSVAAKPAPSRCFTAASKWSRSWNRATTSVTGIGRGAAVAALRHERRSRRRRRSGPGGPGGWRRRPMYGLARRGGATAAHARPGLPHRGQQRSPPCR